MRAMFAQLTKQDFQLRGTHIKEEQARLYALADLVWEEVHRTDQPRSEVQIRIWLTEMEQILKSKRRRR
jgi:hypothetical protein